MKQEIQEQRKIDSERICKDMLGFVPTEEQWAIWGTHDPGALKLMLMVLDKSYFYRNIKKEKY